MLVSSGIGLVGKKLVRLRWDLDKALHSRISALQTADERAEAEGEQAALMLGIVNTSICFGRLLL